MERSWKSDQANRVIRAEYEASNDEREVGNLNEEREGNGKRGKVENAVGLRNRTTERDDLIF